MKRRDLIQRLAMGAAVPLLARGAEPQAPAPASRPKLLTGICAYSFRNELQKKTMQYEDLVRLAADLGVDGLDLTVYWFPDTPHTPDDFFVNLRRVAYRAGVDLYSIAIRSNMCRGTAEAQAAEANALKPWLDVADRLGARHVRIACQSPRGTSTEQAAAWAVETTKRCAELAGKRGTFLGIEDDGTLTENGELLVSMIKQIDSPWVGINLDVGNFRRDPYRNIELCAPYAVNVHFKPEVMEDGKPVAADWARIIKTLAPVYRGHLALEYESQGDPRTAVPELIGKLQRLLAANSMA